MGHVVGFVSDLHGSGDQYEKLVRHVISNLSIRTLILGGDLAPRYEDCEHDFVANQYRFFRGRFVEYMRRIKEARSDLNIFAISGNHDCHINDDVLGEHPDLYSFINELRAKIDDEFEIFGYSFCPISTHVIKDRERFDLTECPIEYARIYNRIMRGVALKGGESKRTRDWTKFWLEEMTLDPNEFREISIQLHLADPIVTKDPSRTVYVMHAPPYGTHLDQNFGGGHYGSIAERLFIEKHHPLLVLSGHFHDTVQASGSFMDRIGSTVCLGTGNQRRELPFIEVDLCKPQEAKRIML
ncbi:MAG: metallophosphoesterase [Candidatus Gracilibacteria bacterium]|jgi:Icc-related predicted phosphoesterase